VPKIITLASIIYLHQRASGERHQVVVSRRERGGGYKKPILWGVVCIRAKKDLETSS